MKKLLDQLGDNPKGKWGKPTTTATIKDASLPPEKMLEVDAKQLTAAKSAIAVKAIQCKFMPDGPDRTISDDTMYGKNIKVEGMSAQQTIFELRQAIANQENVDFEDVNLYNRITHIPDKNKIGDMFVDWTGFGFDSWPPQFIVKPRVRGFELGVSMDACRDTSLWSDGRLLSYQSKELLFDVEPSTTVRELKELVFKRSKIPADRQKLTAQIHRNNRSVLGEYVDLDDDSKSLSDIGIDGFCAKINFEKNPFDANGMYVFDDAYFDDAGYHPQPLGAWIPQDSIANRSRPDASKNDPAAPAMILTDRTAAAAAKSE